MICQGNQEISYQERQEESVEVHAVMERSRLLIAVPQLALRIALVEFIKHFNTVAG